jgi:hypothetical protein
MPLLRPPDLIRGGTRRRAQMAGRRTPLEDILMADSAPPAADVPPPPAPSWLVPASEWKEPDLHIRPHHLERQRSQTGPASDDSEAGRI